MKREKHTRRACRFVVICEHDHQYRSSAFDLRHSQYHQTKQTAACGDQLPRRSQAQCARQIGVAVALALGVEAGRNSMNLDVDFEEVSCGLNV